MSDIHPDNRSTHPPIPEPPPTAPQPEGDATGGIIPYKNPPALIAYYLGLFSIFPLVGLILAVPAVILGVQGLRKKRRKPHVKGSVHAWVGIGCGGLSIFFWGGMLILAVIGALQGG